MSAFDRTLEQRRENLVKANFHRSQRARLKKRIRIGDQSVVALLDFPPAAIETMKVLTLLMAVRGVARVKAARILDTCRISSSKQVGSLTERQRVVLVTELQRRDIK